MVERSHSSGNLHGNLESVTMQKPGQLGSPSGTALNRGIVFSGMHPSASRPGFNAGGISGSLYQLQQPIRASTQHRGHQVTKALFGFRKESQAPVKQGVQEVHSEDDLDKVVSQADEPVMVEFTTTWCGPCKLFGPIYDQMALDYGGKAKFLKVTVNENEATKNLGKRYNVRSIPSFLLFQNNEIIAQEHGIRVELDLRSALNSALCSASRSDNAEFCELAQ